MLLAVAVSLLTNAQHANAQEALSTVCVAAPLSSKAFNVGGKAPAYRLNEYIISTPRDVMEAAAKMKSNGDESIKEMGDIYSRQNEDLKAASKDQYHNNDFVVVRPPYAGDLYGVENPCGTTKPAWIRMLSATGYAWVDDP